MNSKRLFSTHPRLFSLLAALSFACTGEVPEGEVPEEDGRVEGDGDKVPPLSEDGSGGAFSEGSGGAPSFSTGGSSSIHPEQECVGDWLLDDFSDPSTFPLFRPYHDQTAGGSMQPAPGESNIAEDTGEEGGNALHASGSGYSNWGAGVGRKFDPPVACKGRSTGIRFRAKGNGPITIALPVSAIVPVEEGGSCTALEACNNSHETTLNLTPSFQSYEVMWSDLEQLPGWGLGASFDPKSVLEVLFAARPEAMPFDFWVDDIELIDNGSPIVVTPDPDPETGTGGGSSVDPNACVLDSILGEAGFNSWFMSRRNAFYSYANLCTALQEFPGFAATGDDSKDRREVAAFFANVARETGELEYIQEITPTTPTYYGRGPIQLTHDYNYRAAGEFLGIDLLSNPDLVATDGVVTWKTALWFWMHSDGAAKGTCHGAIVNGLGFGQTINIINGGLECNGPNQGANERIAYYQDYMSRLGEAPEADLDCW